MDAGDWDCESPLIYIGDGDGGIVTVCLSAFDSRLYLLN